MEEYFKQAIAIPILDQIITDIFLRFNDHAKQAATLKGLLPRKLKNTSSVSDTKSATAFYAEDLPNVDVVDEEFHS